MQKTNNIRILFLILFLGTNCIGYSQFSDQQIVSLEASLPILIKATDVDGDGDQDVLSASYGDDTIGWYENMDGLGGFGPRKIISNTLESTQHLYTSDLDGDNDIDVIADSRVDDLVVWYKNLDGLGNFSNAITISTSAINPKEVIAADLDGDNDNDIIVASGDDNKVAWYENLDGAGNFGVEQIISDELSLPFGVFAADLDGDLDMDIVMTSVGNQSIYWVKNLNGEGDFGALREISNNSFGVRAVVASDLNNDGDNDVISALVGGNRVDWYENLNGAGSFGPQLIVSNNLIQAADVVSCDLDNDNDNDLVWVAAGSNEVAWQQNDGDGNFSSKQVLSTEQNAPMSVDVADIDGDGAKDVVVSSIADDKIAWYKNEILSMDEFAFKGLSMYPNPVSNLLTIENTQLLETTQIQIHDMAGRLVLNQGETHQLDVSDLHDGIYVVSIATNEGVWSKTLIKE